MVQNNKKKKTPTQRLSPQSGIGHHAHGAPDNPNNKDQETSPDKDNPKDGINPNPTSSQLTTENIVNEPNQLIEERMVMGLPPTPWVEEQHSQREVRRAQGAPSASGRRAISKTDLHSKALPRLDWASDRASRSNYNTIKDRVEDDTDDCRSRSIRELEEEAQSAMEQLSRARNDRARDLSRRMDSHHSMGSDVDRHGHASDENIHQAMQQLHTPKWFPKETLGESESRMAASARMCAKHRDEKRDERRRLRRIRELDEESNQLTREQAKIQIDKVKS